MTFTIDPSGSRVIDNDRPATIAAFGDSFAFCRQVGDGETWESALGPGDAHWRAELRCRQLWSGPGVAEV